jgi:hypothetical protein
MRQFAIDKIKLHKGTHVLILRICEYVGTHNKGETRLKMKLRFPVSSGNYPG